MKFLREFNPWLGILPAAVVFVVGYFADIGSRSARLATAGAVIAVIGVATLGRPVIRLGYKDWLARSKIIDGGTLEPNPEEIAKSVQEDKDALAVQVTGPILIVTGTMLNGISGFF